ncbi:MAG TPA: DUF2200 domain-containing protein [Sphingomicrobium sp.]|nr:DUF2200 domain-containing protein [Sphingomicrobium sp.]
MSWDRVYKMPFAAVYPQYVRKAEAKGRKKAEVDEIIRWLTGYSQAQLEALLADGTDYRSFIEQAPAPNPARSLITGTICGDRVQDIEEPLKREIRYIDKLVDELAKGRPMSKILRD